MAEGRKGAWEKLIELYADGRPICNCHQAYYSPIGVGLVNGERRTDMLACEGGCQANIYGVREYIAERVIEDSARSAVPTPPSNGKEVER